MYKLFVFVLLPSLCLAHPGLLDFITGKNDCDKASFSGASDCAILYDDEDCDGWEEKCTTGYHELPFLRKNDAESVVVKKGCTFIGYQHADKDSAKRGGTVLVDAKGKTKNVAKDFDDAVELESRISAYMCTC